MIHIVLGTKAQLIKMAPVIKALESRNVPFNFIHTGQHRDTMAEIQADFAIRRPDCQIYDGPEVDSIRKMAYWMSHCLWRTLRLRKTLFRGDRLGVVLVHGDTFSTLLGALMGRLAGLKVAHVESGLRSFNLFHPFPEEITRLLVFRLSHIFFCPGEKEIRHIAGIRGVKVNTRGNTLKDSVSMAPKGPQLPGAVRFDRYGVATLHRFENFSTFEGAHRVVQLVQRIAEQLPLLFVLHQFTRLRLQKWGLWEAVTDHPRIQTVPRFSFFDFIGLLRGAELVVSDGGSNQEECSYLGLPIILLRDATERQEGLGKNCLLSRYDADRIDEFVRNRHSYRRSNPAGHEDSPSKIIMESLSAFTAEV
jgi:UDP-N-acetylglucosamine 2-epimerase (non-hydrolysing)